MSVLTFVSELQPTTVTIGDRLESANIGMTSLSFRRYFPSSKIVSNAPKKRLEFYDLTQRTSDKAIRAELSENHTIGIEQFLDLIEAQRNGEDGPLLLDGHNIAFVADANGIVWIMSANCLRESGVLFWSMIAASVGLPFVWNAGTRVVSGK